MIRAALLCACAALAAKPAPGPLWDGPMLPIATGAGAQIGVRCEPHAFDAGWAQTARAQMGDGGWVSLGDRALFPERLTDAHCPAGECVGGQVSVRVEGSYAVVPRHLVAASQVRELKEPQEEQEPCYTEVEQERLGRLPGARAEYNGVVEFRLSLGCETRVAEGFAVQLRTYGLALPGGGKISETAKEIRVIARPGGKQVLGPWKTLPGDYHWAVPRFLLIDGAAQLRVAWEEPFACCPEMSSAFFTRHALTDGKWMHQATGRKWKGGIDAECRP